MVRALRARRSELATPASSERMCEKAPATGADLVFLDLEDACAPSVKESARGIAVGALTGLDWGRTVRAVRINGIDTPWCHGDIIEIVTGARECVDVLIVPKVRTAPRRLVGGRAADPARNEARAVEAHRPRSADRGRGRVGPGARDRAGERPSRGVDLRRGRPLRVAARPGRRQLRPGDRLPRRLLALRPRSGADRGKGRDGGCHRRAVPGLRESRRLPTVRVGGKRARL